MPGDTDRLSHLTPAQRALLEKALLERAARLIQAPAIPRRAADGPAPLSYSQQRLWFVQQYLGESPLYHIPLLYRLAGPVDAALLEQALNLLVARHAMLRTSFTVAGEEPVQQVLPALTVPLQQVDLLGAEPGERERQAMAWCQAEVRRPFRLAAAPLFRAALLRLGPQEHLFLLTMHHIITDGWSQGVLFGELAQAYAALAAGTEPTLPPLPISYADYAAWQRREGGVPAAQLAYWRKQLAGPLPVLDLPTDRPRPPERRYRGAKQTFHVPAALTAALRALGQQTGTTLFMVLLAAFETLLLRRSHQTEIAVGTPVAGRSRRELEGLVGFFVNTLVLRTDLSGDLTFTELLQRVKQVALDAFANPDVPFERLVEELNPERSASRSPLFQVIFTLQNASGTLPALGEAQVCPVTLDLGVALFDLILGMEERGEELFGTLQYDTDLFDAATAQGMAEQFLALLDTVVRNPAESISAGASRVAGRLPGQLQGQLPGQLPEQLRAPGAVTDGEVSPRNDLESALAAVFAEVLGLPRVSITADFFELGGHSLLATRVVTRIRDRLRAEISLRTFFAAPTVAELALEVAAATEAAAPLTIQPRESDDPAPLSFAQQRLWFLDRMEPDSPFYTIAGVVRLQGALRVELLAASLNQIVQRHAALRTRFRETPAGPVQEVTPAGPFDLPVVDLEHLPEPGARAEAAARLAESAARQPFDLEHGPLLRATLFRLGPEEHRLLLTMHHIISDGWSMSILFQELGTLYAAGLTGSVAPLAPLPVQYPDFAAWQRQWLSGAVLREQLGYWRRQLAGAAPVLDLPFDRPRPPVQSFRGARHSFTIPAALVGGLRKLSQATGATLFMTLLTAWGALLHRYARQDEVLIGSPVANRNRSEVEGLIGFFVNTLVMRVDATGAPSFRDLLTRVREACLGAYAHQDLPFEKLVEELQPERSMSHHPLFQVLFALQNTPALPLEIPGLAVGLEPVETGVAQFDLSLLLTESGDEIRGALLYSTDLFDGATAERLASHFLTLLAGVVADPAASVADLPLLPPGQERLLAAWSAPAETGWPRQATIPALFEAQPPEAIALLWDGGELTYGELNRQANRLAHRLQALGVGPDSLVGIAVERSPAMVAGLLAILKAGGAYVPVDPDYPPERIAFMLADTGLAAMVTTRALADRLPLGALPVLCVEERLQPGRDENPGCDENPACGAGPEHLAYVLYTSGSTGTPKGVAVPHRAVVRLVREPNYIRIGEDEVFLQAAPLSFDASTLELFGPLLCGGRLALLPPGAPSLEELGSAIRRFGVTTLWLTAGLFLLMVEEQLEALRGVRQLLAGGDVLSVPHVQRVLTNLPGVRLINGYGPTENTTFTCCHPVSISPEASVPIGRPIGGTTAYVLDGQMRPVPPGVPGELYTGGAGLARGYLGRPDLTAERFVPDPFSPDPGARLYRTGDLVRWLPDGTLQFLGRVDRQVKLRGFRIEPREIEAALERHPAVRGALVTVREEQPGDKRLVAYVMPGDLAVAELREYLRGALPEFMVPSALVPLPAFPLTPNGKVDLRALPAPEFAADESTVEPRNETESALAAIFAEVLGHPRVSVTAGFFELGGHSLLATRVVTRIRDRFGVELPLRSIFQAPTVAALALQVAAATAVAAPQVIRPRESDAPAPLSFAQQRLWFLDRLEPGSPFYTIAGLVRLQGDLRVDLLRASLSEIVQRHAALRTRFHETPAGPVQEVAPPAPFDLHVIDLEYEPQAEEAAARLAESAARQPFDLKTGPLLRATLFRLGPQEHRLLLAMHHIIADGWSMSILFRELGSLYAAGLTGGVAPLTPLPVQYPDFAAWQRQWLSGAVLQEQLDYWRGQLADADFVLNLPLDRPRPPVQSFRGAQHRFTIPAALVDRLRRLSQNAEATLFMTLLTAWGALLHRHAGQEQVLVGTPIAGRRHKELEELIGFFVGTLVMKVDANGDPTFRDLLARVRETCLGAYAHQDLPFERLVEALQPQRSLSHHPLFQVMFTLQNTPALPLELPGLTGQLTGVETGTAQFDLALTLQERDGELQGSLEYSTDLFDAATAGRMAAQFQTLLAAAAAAPETPVSRLPLLTAAERQQLLTAWNETDRSPATNGRVHELFAEQALRHPEAVAAVCGPVSLTYGELNRRANALARQLQARGAGPDKPIGLFMERSPELLVGLLAILKAGGAYVPIDPAYPAERIRFMLADCAIESVVTVRRLAEQLPPQHGTIFLVDDPAESAPVASVTPASHANLAYIIYTSGSTGLPKGVAVEHRALANHCQAVARQYRMTRTDRVLQFAAISFDVAAEEIFPTWLAGATLVLPPVGGLVGTADLERLIESERLSVLNLPAAYWHEWVPELLRPGAKLPPSLRLVIAGSERVSPVRYAQWLTVAGNRVAFANAYGPTEATITATIFLPESPPAPAGDPGAPLRELPIGRPIDNVRVYLLDRHLEPVPVGLPGELYIGGAGLARGYWNRPDLTAAHFIPDPYAGRPGARLYRTGDLARYLPDGQLEFLGRADHQVKIRGFRIEPGEVQAVLARHPAVAETAVVARGDAEQRYLVAYIVPRRAATLDTVELKGYLLAHLPPYMVPAAFVALDRLPLTANGKVNLKALPAPALAQQTAAPQMAPQTRLEGQIAAIWQEVLQVEQVSIYDNFFDIGGHSLRLVQVQNRLQAALGREIPVVDLFRYPTISGLARFLEPEQTAPADDAPALDLDRADNRRDRLQQMRERRRGQR